MSRYGQATRQPLTVAKCKRIVRPLLSKIHSLNDLYIKYPGLLDLHLPNTDAHVHKNTSKRKNSDRESSERQGRYYSDSEFSDTEGIQTMFTNQNASQSNDFIQELVKPKDSFDRLRSLKSLVEPELFDSYCEIFQIFRNIVSSVLLTCKSPMEDTVPRLSTGCCVLLGKSIALSTKSSYYKVNQSRLFDANTVPQDIRAYQQELFDDIDNWLDMEPKVIFGKYTNELFMGYIAYLLLVHRRVLYLLIPIFLNWLVEESINHPESKPILSTITNRIFQEYWTFGSGFDTSERNLVTSLNGVIIGDYEIKQFWTFHKLGYWQEFINTLQIKSSYDSKSTYECLMLESIKVSGVIDNRIIKESNYNFKEFLVNIYHIISLNPQHHSINTILTNIISEIISSNRSSIAGCRDSSELIDLFENSSIILLDFIRFWLGFTSTREMVFNSLQDGNEDIFTAVLSFCQFINYKISKVIELMAETLEYDTDYEVIINRYKFFKDWIINIIKAIEIFRTYYLDKYEVKLQDNSPRDIAKAIVAIQEVSSINQLANDSFQHFIYWLVRHNNAELARECFLAHYGKSSWFDEELVEDMRYDLFEDIE
ncbi:uncharacterized protein RJT21DRAFT_53521 [Scheffersomyces amazonensis]|uniref:uncharacterized protein n=1 Tax=Scheffersomyces amazonensis TaxID=1078765 RepID=UPI00315D90F1